MKQLTSNHTLHSFARLHMLLWAPSIVIAHARWNSCVQTEVHPRLSCSLASGLVLVGIRPPLPTPTLYISGSLCAPRALPLSCPVRRIACQSQPIILAPPVCTASISTSLHGVRRNRLGRSFRSKTSPAFASTGPRDAPLCPPIAP